MKTKLTMMLVGLLGASLLVGCSEDTEKETTKEGETKQIEQVEKKEDPKSPEDEAVYAAKTLMRDFIEANNEGDTDNYLSLLHLTEDDSEEEIRAELEELFENFNLTVELEGEPEVKSVSDDFKKVVLDIIQITKFPEGTDRFTNNTKAWVTHTAEYQDGKWGITDSVTTKVEPIE